MPGASSLEIYPRPAVAVDLAIFTVLDPASSPDLRVLIQWRDDPPGWVLPGAFMRERATVAETVADVLRRKVTLPATSTPEPRLLRMFDDPERDDRTWAISLAHSLSLPAAEVVGLRGELARFDPDGALPDGRGLLFDHAPIVSAALIELRERYEIRQRFVDLAPDPDRFLAEPFTLHQLRRVHEAVVGAALHKDNFNRRMKPLLRPLLRRGEPVLASQPRGRPAALYRRG